jgi:NDP-sugar pyrophosphorylase family protein
MSRRSVVSAERSVSSDGHVTYPVSPHGQCLAALDVLVIAGGLGTRIAPVLGDTPKLLAPIAGRPYLVFLLDWLRRFGAKRIVFGLGHQAHAVIDFLDHNKSVHDDLTVVTVSEPQPLGTAGAVRFARPQLRSDPVLVMNGDSFAGADLCAFVEHHRRAKARATLLCAEVDDASRYGRVELDGDGRIRGFIEKDPDFHGKSAVSAGVYLFCAALLDEIAAGSASSLEREVFGCAPPGSLDAFAGRFVFIDIGTPESLALAERVFSSTAESQPL